MARQGTKVSALYGFEPAGVVGYADQKDARVYPAHLSKEFIVQHFGRILEKDQDYIPKKTAYGYAIPRRLIQSYHNMLKDPPTVRDRLQRFAALSSAGANFGKRLLSGLTVLSVSRAVVPERLRTVWTENHDYENLIQAGVPVNLFCGTLSDNIHFDGVQKKVNEWRTNPAARVQLISSKTQHFAINSDALGVGFAAALKPA